MKSLKSLKSLFLSIVLLFPLSLLAQFTTVTAQVKDPGNLVYQSCHYNIDFVNNTGIPQLPLLSGAPFQTTFGEASCDSTGHLSIRLADSGQITPPGTQWHFSICTADRSQCFGYTSPACPAIGCITGTTIDISAALLAVAAALNQAVPTNAAQTFTFVQALPGATTWTVNHNFGVPDVAVTVYDQNGNLVVPDSVQAINSNTTVITFLQAQAGRAYIINAAHYTPTAANPNFLVANPTGSQAVLGDFPFLIGGSLSAKRTNGTLNVKNYGAAGNGVTDDTAAIQTAITEGCANGNPVLFPPGTYKVVPATAFMDGSVSATGAFQMCSNMHIIGSPNTTIKVADNQSTDASPKDLGMFFSNNALSNITFDCRGMSLDMNAANNLISPSRPATYNLFGMSQIVVSGDSGRIDDAEISGCKFLNTSGTNNIVAAESNTPGITLGKRWKVHHNLFKNGGTDTSDYTAFYGWADAVDFHDNICWSDTQFGAVGKTGSQTCFEVHGANSDYHNNIVAGPPGVTAPFLRCGYLANNYTSPVTNSLVHDNVCNVLTDGIDIFNGSASSGGNFGNKIYNNTCKFDDTTWVNGPGAKACIFLETDRSVSDIQIEHNHVFKTGTTYSSALAIIAPTTTGQPYSNIRVNFNTATGTTIGIQFRTNFVVANLGYVEAIGNEFNALANAAGNSAIGIYVDATNTVKTLVLDGNKFIDEQGSPTMQYGIYLVSGTITDLYVGSQQWKNMQTSNYVETGGITITNRRGMMLPSGSPLTWTLAGATAPDTSLSRFTNGGLAVGKGQQGDGTGTFAFGQAWFAESGSALVGTAATSVCQSQTSDHNIRCSYNADGAAANGYPMTRTIGSGTVTTAGTAVTNGTSQAQTAITIAGALTTDVAQCSLNAAMPATWQTGIQLLPPVVTANTVTIWLSNPTAGSITPAAATVRCTVTR